MGVLGKTDAALDIFGGLVTDVAPADLPPGASPDCADVAFVPGAVKTRPGLLSVFTAIAGNPTVNYLKTFVQPNLAETMLALDSAGSLWAELAPGALTQINSGGRKIYRAELPRQIHHSLWPRIHRFSRWTI